MIITMQLDLKTVLERGDGEHAEDENENSGEYE